MKGARPVPLPHPDLQSELLQTPAAVSAAVSTRVLENPTQPNPAALPLAHPELSHAARILFKNSPRATATPPPPRTPPGALRLGRPCPGLRAARSPLLPAGACALGPSPIRAGGGGSREKGALRGGKGPNPEITRMWSPRAHAQCPSDKLAATTRPPVVVAAAVTERLRVAEPVLAPARRPREALPAWRSAAPRPSPGAGARDGSRRPRARPPVAGRLRSSSGPARAVRGPRRGAARRGEGPPGPDAAGGTRQATARRGAQVTRGPPPARASAPAPLPRPGAGSRGGRRERGPGEARVGRPPRAPSPACSPAGPGAPTPLAVRRAVPGDSSAVRAAALCCSGGVWPRPGPSRRAAGSALCPGCPGSVRPRAFPPQPSVCFLFVPTFSSWLCPFSLRL